MNIKNLLYFELIEKLLKDNPGFRPGNVLRLHLDISIPIDNQRYRELNKALYTRAVELNQLRGSCFYPYYENNNINIEKTEKTFSDITKEFLNRR